MSSKLFETVEKIKTDAITINGFIAARYLLRRSHRRTEFQ